MLYLYLIIKAVRFPSSTIFFEPIYPHQGTYKNVGYNTVLTKPKPSSIHRCCMSVSKIKTKTRPARTSNLNPNRIGCRAHASIYTRPSKAPSQNDSICIGGRSYTCSMRGSDSAMMTEPSKKSWQSGSGTAGLPTRLADSNLLARR
jgi:hypothetical protein